MVTNTLIVVVSYNSEGFIENCLKSILEQTYKGWFLLVIDNDSKDGTISRINEFKNSSSEISNKNFKLISLRKNIGFSRAVNYAVFRFISKRKELEENIKYLILINSDIYLFRDALENLILPFEAESEKASKIHFEHDNDFEDYSNEIGVVGGLILDYKKDIIQHLGGKISPNFITTHLGRGIKFGDSKSLHVEKSKDKADRKYIGDAENNGNAEKSLKEVDYVTGALFATKFWLFRKLGGFDAGYRPAYYEELDYCIKVKKLGRKIGVNPASIARHFEGASSGKFSRKFYCYYHKNRIRCAVINFGFINFFKRFFWEEIKWIKNQATKDQYIPLMCAYFLNFMFLPYNLMLKVKNYLILSRLRLK